MRAVLTSRGAVGCDARYADAGPGHVHLNAGVCERIESIAWRKPGILGGPWGSVECAGKRSLNYREAGSEGAWGARAT